MKVLNLLFSIALSIIVVIALIVFNGFIYAILLKILFSLLNIDIVSNGISQSKAFLNIGMSMATIRILLKGWGLFE